MSVINQMLQDLETRRGALDGQHAEPVSIRPAGIVHERRVPRAAVALGALVAALLAVAAWWLLRDRPEPIAPVAAPLATVQQPASAPVSTPPQASAPVAATPVPIDPPAAKPLAAAPTVTASVPVVQAPAPIAPAATVKKAEPAKSAEPSTAVPAKLAALPESAEVLTAPPAAEKPAPLANAARASAKPTRERGSAPIPGMETEVQNFKQRNPQQRVDDRYRDALRKLNEGQLNAARADLTEVLQSQPKHSGARLALVGIELEERRGAQAEKLLRDGIQLQPSENAFSMALARLEVERGDVDAALGTLARAQNSASGDADYHGFYAALLQRAGRHAEAIEHYQLALRQREAANWLIGLGISLEAANRARDAEQIYRRAQQSAGLTNELQDFANQRLQQLRR